MGQQVNILKTTFLLYSVGTEDENEAIGPPGWISYLFSAGCLGFFSTYHDLAIISWLRLLGRGYHRIIAQVNFVIFFLELEFSP